MRTRPSPHAGPGDSNPIPKPRTAHPVPVKAGVAELLGTYLSSPSRARIEDVWSALEHRPSSAETIASRLRRARTGRMRAALALCLAAANRDSAVQSTLLRLLDEDGSATVRAVAAAALARSSRGSGVLVETPLGIGVHVAPIRSADLRRRLLHVAESERSDAVLRTIIQALGPSQSLDPALTRRFLELARTAAGPLRRAAVKAVQSGGLTDPGPILDVIRDDSADAKLRAALVPAAAKAAGDRAGDVLTTLIDESESPQVRAAAVMALPESAPQTTLSTAQRLLRGDDRTSVKLAAISALSKLGTKAAIKEIEWAADQATDEKVRSVAQGILGRHRPGKPPVRRK